MAIRTFNSAKKFAEEVLHELIDDHKKARLRTRLGAVTDEEARKLSFNQRVINRFNALKERIVLQQTLINEVEATVRLNGVKCEIAMIEELKKNLDIVEVRVDEHSEDILYFTLFKGTKTPQLTKDFKKLVNYLDSTYVQIQRLMTKNKLLFFTDDDEFLEDQELKEKIKIDNRSA